MLSSLAVQGLLLYAVCLIGIYCVVGHVAGTVQNHDACNFQ